MMEAEALDFSRESFHTEMAESQTAREILDTLNATAMFVFKPLDKELSFSVYDASIARSAFSGHRAMAARNRLEDRLAAAGLPVAQIEAILHALAEDGGA